jgi:hypothetical protein
MWPSPLPGTFLLKLSDPDRFKNTLFVLYVKMEGLRSVEGAAEVSVRICFCMLGSKHTFSIEKMLIGSAGIAMNFTPRKTVSYA